MPSGEGAVDELARIVELLGTQPFDFNCTQPVQDFSGGIGDVLGFPRDHLQVHWECQTLGLHFGKIGTRTGSGPGVPSPVERYRVVDHGYGGSKTNVVPPGQHLPWTAGFFLNRPG